MVENLSSFDKDMLLRWFIYFMPMGSDGENGQTKATRFEFMRQFPAVYNQLFGKTVEVQHLASGTPA